MLRLTALISMAALLATAAGAEDWSTWGGGPNKNMVNLVETGIPSSWDVDTGENVKWMVELGSQSYGNPTIHEGKLFVGTNNGAEYDKAITGDKGIVLAFRESDGEFLWQAVHDKLPAGRVNDWPEQGVCSTVAAEGDRLWYVSNRCEIICLDTEGFYDGENDGVQDEQYTGEKKADIVWRLDMMSDELGVFPHNLATSSPLLVGDMIYVVTSNGVDEGHLIIPSPRAPSFLAVNKNTGEVVWEARHPGRNILHGQWSSPAYGEVDGKGQVYMAGGDGWLYAYDALDGSLVWKFDLNPKDAIWELGGRGTRNNIIATPAFHEGSVYLGVGQDPEHGVGTGHFYRIDATQKGDVTATAMKWVFHGEGELVFQRTLSSASVHEGLVYISDINGFLYCLDGENGKLLWNYDTLAAIWGSPTVIDGKVYLGDEDGDVVVLKTGRTQEVIGEMTVNNSAYTTPVAANGRLYIANRSEVYAMEVGAKLEAGGGE